MSACAFVRCHAYQAKKIGDILAEASRHMDFVSHISKPEKPSWPLGSPDAVKTAIADHMSKLTPVKTRKGAIFNRKRRFDHRCLVAGTASWPDSVEACRDKDYPKDRLAALKEWRKKLFAWLDKNFGDKLIAVCVHLDESHPHVHFFVVGDAQRLHPGMKNELVNNVRLVVSADRLAAHRAGLRSWLDDYYSDVGQPCGLQRSLGSRPTWRVRDRGVRARLFEIDKALAERPDDAIQKKRDKLWDDVLKSPSSRMIF